MEVLPGTYIIMPSITDRWLTDTQTPYVKPQYLVTIVWPGINKSGQYIGQSVPLMIDNTLSSPHVPAYKI